MTQLGRQPHRCEPAGRSLVSLTLETPRRTLMILLVRSRSLRRSSVSSPNRSAHHAAMESMSRRRSGMARIIRASSSLVTGSILWRRVVLPPPRTLAGLEVVMRSRSIAVPRIVRSSP